ncbi:hypothetical protein AVEN_11378-1 [Araneus ventricosus]|uniref:Uncharacterized protein n=1 Tax=Araneus ventricosus TaxID=182803 RepID=A0A4Y2DXH4_ARAVE|nr:hypothetical protein AVEN_11378-1 [Araneus ventricosus]
MDITGEIELYDGGEQAKHDVGKIETAEAQTDLMGGMSENFAVGAAGQSCMGNKKSLSQLVELSVFEGKLLRCKHVNKLLTEDVIRKARIFHLSILLDNSLFIT